MRTTTRAAIIPLLAILVAACSSAATTAPTSPPAPTSAPSVAPSAAPSAAPSEAPSVAPSPTPNACAAPNLQTLAAGKLTIGTDNPAYPPYFQPDAGKAPAPWQLGDPTNGQGFESAVAYAIASQLGYTKDQVTWTVVPFDNSFKPGKKPFDLYMAQVSYTADRAKAVDMSDGYYFLSQSVVALKTNPIASAKTIGDLKKYRFGAQQGTTSLDAINAIIAPTAKPSIYNTNDAAIAALKARQIDGIVVDLPTAFFITAVQLDNGVIVGQFPPATQGQGEHFSVVLAKDSPLTACVNGALAAMQADGSLQSITTQWLSEKASAPIFQP